jgi:hypothetical protein
MVTIEESNMFFGEYSADDVFLVEKSAIREHLGVKPVEFVLRYRTGEILLIEAKSSSPQPSNEIDFGEFIAEITEKFVHTVELYFAVVLSRLNDTKDEMPECFKSADYATTEVTLLLVIHGHKIQWLPPIKDALKSQLKRTIKTWRLEVAVMNHEQAFSYGLTTS